MDYPPTRLPGRGPGWYRGDLHVHSVHSDGELTPAELAVAARAVGLDFLATTEHNAAAAPGRWGEVGGDDLLVLLGEEVTTGTGHWLALGLEPGRLADWRHRLGEAAFDEALRAVRAAGGLCVAAHPHAPYPGGELMYPLESFDAVEVWNGQWSSALPWNADNEAALAEWGRRLGAGVRSGRPQPAVGSSDTHLPGQLGVPQTVVHAEELSVPAVLAAVRAGRSWIAGTAAVQLEFTAEAAGRTAGIGERLATGGRPVDLAVRLSGVPDGSTVHFRTEAGRAHRAPADELVRWSTDAGRTGFVRVEVRGPDGRAVALTNPVLLA
ncbi:CehA/McbA family metallohydrolase [Kitasatospora sp. NA04385]|uniref:CehA/McbA family metallohydrolase n=1 Tax=Kitasatospora sp. NA04385 TaxID=2742135 RepID=UPI00159265D6|nr:CehA/McbA family metallohydrolase [Kitasatospora sp. NA04385]QKW18330.1 CehA/McbA family metallohydrolase [Kitasatospora sp. NA04385]